MFFKMVHQSVASTFRTVHREEVEVCFFMQPLCEVHSRTLLGDLGFAMRVVLDRDNKARAQNSNTSSVALCCWQCAAMQLQDGPHPWQSD